MIDEPVPPSQVQPSLQQGSKGSSGTNEEGKYRDVRGDNNRREETIKTETGKRAPCPAFSDPPPS
jgi:hypothetical protein